MPIITKETQKFCMRERGEPERWLEIILVIKICIQTDW